MTRRVWLGVVTGIASLGIFTLAMLPIRSHVSVATDALILLIPVLLAVAVGGFGAGVVGAVAGFLVYDWFFIPPYGTFTVGRPQNWVALFVYVAVVLVVARIVSSLQESRDEARFRERAIQRVFVVTQQLITTRPVDELLDLVASTVQRTFAARWVVLLLPTNHHLSIAAESGGPLSDEERAAITHSEGVPQSMTLTATHGDVTTLALSSDAKPVGQLVIAGATLSALDRELLGTFANHAALAIERGQLRDAAMRSEVLEEIDKWRQALLGAASHDLRTPLASMKTAVSLLRTSVGTLTPEDRSALLEMIEDQCDHLARLVSSLLDVARLEAGTLTLHREPHGVDEIVDTAILSIGMVLARHQLVKDIERDLPLVDVDVVLIAQVLANLLTNAAQNSPDGTRITVAAHTAGDHVRLSVADEGRGVDTEDRERIFHMMDQRAGSGRAGLGLSLSRAFVNAHGESLRVVDAPGGGAKFLFDVPAITMDEMIS